MQLFPAKKNSFQMDGLISSSTSIGGEVVFKGNMRIEGKVNGNVVSDNDPNSILVIAETAVINGDIFASDLIVNGTVKGQIHATKLVQVENKANVDGDITYSQVSMLAGAVVNGKLIHKPVNAVNDNLVMNEL